MTTHDGAEPGGGDISTYDVIVIGAGSTGTSVAGYARDNGLSVVVIESRLVGGECSYYACMPSKALLEPPNALAQARRLPGAAGALSGSIDTSAVLKRRDEFISHLDDGGQADWLDSVGAELIRGRGRVAGERRVDVTGADGSVRTLMARLGVVIATGSRPSMPPIDGLAEANPWTNREATTAEEVPQRLAILGGGVVGCELAQAFTRLGAQVTIIERGDRILENYDLWVSELVGAAFEGDGIDIRLGANAAGVRREPNGGPVCVGFDDGTEIEADQLLVATGRAFNVEDLGLQAVGLDGDGPLEVDDQLRVAGVDGGWLFAAGDVNGRALLTHQGKYQARCVGDVLGGRERAAFADHAAVPQVVFTDPQVAAVGVAPSKADGDPSLRKVGVKFESVAGASLSGDTRGRAELVIDNERDVVVGALFVGGDVGELLHSATVAIVGEVPIARLWHAVPAFPTRSEVWLRLLEADRGVNDEN
ncbi:MAG: NAD(P)/FAD-dependent oxidoreductase [Aquihabitans sp.]